MADGADDATALVHIAHQALDAGIAGKVEHGPLAADEVDRGITRSNHVGHAQARGQFPSRPGIVEEGEVGGHHVLVIAPHRRCASAGTGDVHLVAVGLEHVVRTRQLG